MDIILHYLKTMRFQLYKWHQMQLQSVEPETDTFTQKKNTSAFSM